MYLVLCSLFMAYTAWISSSTRVWRPICWKYTPNKYFLNHWCMTSNYLLYTWKHCLDLLSFGNILYLIIYYIKLWVSYIPTILIFQMKWINFLKNTNCQKTYKKKYTIKIGLDIYLLKKLSWLLINFQNTKHCVHMYSPVNCIKHLRKKLYEFSIISPRK